MGLLASRSSFAVAVVTMEQAEAEAIMPKRLSSLYGGRGELQRVAPKSDRLAAYEQREFDLGGVTGYLTFMTMPEGMRGIAHLRTLKSMWASFDGWVLVATEEELRETSSVFANLFLCNLSSIDAAGRADVPRVILQVSKLPDPEVPQQCEVLSGPWAQVAPVTVQSIAPASSVTGDELVKAAIDWLVAKMRQKQG